MSDLDREKGLAAGVGTPDQYVTIHEINDLAPYGANTGERGAARLRLGLPDDCPVVGTVGRFSEQKDPITWVRAAAAVAQQRRDAHFVMIGDGPLRAEAERVAAELGLAARLVTTGLRDDVPELLPAFDVFLLTSRWEGLPLVIPQAMASGVPVVASNADGNREVVRHRENGLLVAPQAPEAAASGTMTLIEDTPLRERIVAGGRRTARAFELGQTIPLVAALYRECVRDGARRTSSITRGGGSA